MTIVLFDTPESHQRFYPLSLTRPLSHIRHGLFAAYEWYAVFASDKVVSLAADYLQTVIQPDDLFICVDSSVVPTFELIACILSLKEGEMLEDSSGMIAYATNKIPVYGSIPLFFNHSLSIAPVSRLLHPMDFVKTNLAKITNDIELMAGKGLNQLSNGQNQLFGAHKVFVESNARVQGCIFNTEDGPVYIGKNAKVMEGSCIRGPVCISEGAIVKMGSQIYQGTTIGKFAVAGGEIKNSILGDFSNKAHHGYLGDSIIGNWCNLGAGTSNSNVRNNAGMVKMWSAERQKYVPIGPKAGVVMGDFSKTAINTSINTGTTIGVGCSIHPGGFTQKHIPSFTWGKGEQYRFQKLLPDIKAWFAFKNQEQEGNLETILNYLYRNTYPS